MMNPPPPPEADTDRIAGGEPDGAAMFRTVADNYSGSIVITDPDNRILYANPSVLRMTGYALGELIGQSPSIFNSGQTPPDVFRSLWETIESGHIWKGDFINRRKDGTQYVENKTIAAIRDVEGRVRFHLAIGEDFSQHERYQQRIENLLTFDPLTGLLNRAAFLNAVIGQISGAARGRSLAVLHVELDDFHTLHDISVAESDLLIAETALRIRQTLRQDDRLARLGNEDFGILLGLHEAQVETELTEIGERLLETIRKPYPVGDRSIAISASIGVACHPDDADSAAELLARAISAANAARKDGGDRCCRFDPSMASNASSQREFLADLRRGLEAGELTLHYQPQVNLFSGEVIGVEALVRWQHPLRGLIPPGEFIPLAENGSLIVAIGEWVLDEACRQLRAWLDSGLPPMRMAVNLAARHFIAPNLHERLAECLARHRIDARQVELEITEGAMMQDVTAAIRSTARLKEIGVRLAVDDFGTGYSSLAYLSRFPVDAVKLDQSFVHDITTNPANAAIAQATIAMAHKLGKAVMAEGIETEEQMRYLRRSECDEMQGYFFSRPQPPAALGDFLRGGPRLRFDESPTGDPSSAVLFLDDEANILSAIRRTLRREGYEILTATNAEEAFALLARTPIQVVVSDQRMPDMNGTEFLSRVKTLHPNTVRMVLSGYSEISAVTDAINKGAVYRFMLKPWDDQKLREEVAGALRHWRERYGSPSDR